MQPALALESCQHHCRNPNPHPNLQNSLGKNFKTKNNHSVGVKPATYAVQSEHATAEPRRQSTCGNFRSFNLHGKVKNAKK